jgi:Fanconi anemia group M protein
MTEDDADVAEYTHETDVTWETVDLPDAVVEIRERLNDVVADRLERLRELGVTRKSSPDLSQSDLNEIRGKLQELIDNDQSEGYTGMSLHAEVMKLRQAVTLVETQSVEAVQRYFERQRQAARSSGASKADQRLVSEPKVKEAISLAREYDGLHPKYSRTRRLVAETLGIEGGDRVIVFTESRDTAEALTEFLDAHFEVARFVGQSDTDGSDGMSQAQQRDTLDAFREGEFEVLVSTSVAEEGLDVPEVDLVLFYEPVPTAIRSIQRKGRTGRQTEGRVVVLMAEDTRDEAYFWISRRREREMEDELRELKGMADELVAELAQSGLDEFADAGDGSTTGTTDGDAESTGTTTTTGEADGQPGLGEFADAGDGSTAGTTDGDADADGDDGTDLTDDVTDAGPGETSDGDTADGGEDDTDHGGEDPVVATADGETETVEVVIDQRELDSTIARDLSLRDGVETRLETLAVGDYVLSDRVVVERKTAADFVDSLVEGDRSVFEQVGDMARHYARPVLVVEGGRPRDQRDVHPNAIRGALASLAVDFDASVLYTDDEGDTADLLEVVAEREQTASDRSVSVHGEKGTKTVAEQQEYVVSAIADVGPVTAKALLADLGSVEAVMTADRDRLREVEGVGQVTADRIREVTAATYDPD